HVRSARRVLRMARRSERHESGEEHPGFHRSASSSPASRRTPSPGASTAVYPRKAAKSCGDLEPEVSVPSLASARFTSALCSTPPVASNRRLTTSAGVPAGTKKPYQKEIS